MTMLRCGWIGLIGLVASMLLTSTVVSAANRPASIKECSWPEQIMVVINEQQSCLTANDFFELSLDEQRRLMNNPASKNAIEQMLLQSLYEGEEDFRKMGE